ncbi:MAG: hypothetical protein ACNA78_00815 [Balneolaceae bacterium]
MKRTKLDVFSFGDDPEDTFYCLVDLQVSPEGLRVEKLKLSDPRTFDEQLKQSGCLMMLTGDEVNELVRRGDLDRDRLEETITDLARREGVLKPSS